MVVNHHRHRKTGPRHPVLVAECRPHGIAFSVYPPGHVPYGRKPLVRLAPDGNEVQRDPVDASAAESLEGTLFEAAADAAGGRAWARAEQLPETGPWWNTQRRHLDVAEQLLGLSSHFDERQRLQIATALQVSLLDLTAAAASLRDSSGYRSHGAATLSVLELMKVRPCLLQRLMRAGQMAGRWGVPYFADPTTHILRSPSTSVHAARASPRHAGLLEGHLRLCGWNADSALS